MAPSVSQLRDMDNRWRAGAIEKLVETEKQLAALSHQARAAEETAERANRHILDGAERIGSAIADIIEDRQWDSALIPDRTVRRIEDTLEVESIVMDDLSGVHGIVDAALHQVRRVIKTLRLREVRAAKEPSGGDGK